MIGVSVAWNGTLNSAAITNSFRAAVAKQAEDNDQIRDALEVAEDGDFDFSDLDDSDPELYR
jgi:hypothetical protein